MLDRLKVVVRRDIVKTSLATLPKSGKYDLVTEFSPFEDYVLIDAKATMHLNAITLFTGDVVDVVEAFAYGNTSTYFHVKKDGAKTLVFDYLNFAQDLGSTGYEQAVTSIPIPKEELVETALQNLVSAKGKWIILQNLQDVVSVHNVSRIVDTIMSMATNNRIIIKDNKLLAYYLQNTEQKQDILSIYTV